MASLLTVEVLRREAVMLLWNAMGHRAGIDQATKFNSQYNALDDTLWLRLDFKEEKAFQDVSTDFLQRSIDQASEGIKGMVEVLPSVQIARRRQFKLRKMKAKSKARTWRMPWLRRKNIWVPP